MFNVYQALESPLYVELRKYSGPPCDAAVTYFYFIDEETEFWEGKWFDPNQPTLRWQIWNIKPGVNNSKVNDIHDYLTKKLFFFSPLATLL